MNIWHSAPPLSFPTNVTLDSASASSASTTSSITPCGDKSASAVIASACAPSGKSKRMHRYRRDRASATPSQRRELASTPWTLILIITTDTTLTKALNCATPSAA